MRARPRLYFWKNTISVSSVYFIQWIGGCFWCRGICRCGLQKCTLYKEISEITVNSTQNGAATWTIYQFSPNKNLFLTSRSCSFIRHECCRFWTSIWHSTFCIYSIISLNSQITMKKHALAILRKYSIAILETDLS